MQEEWITTGEAADIADLSISGFRFHFGEEKRRAQRGKNTMKWKVEGVEYRLLRSSVEAYFGKGGKDGT